MHKRWQYNKHCTIVVLLLTAFISGSFKPVINKTGGVKTIVIDAGHGGKDPGCLGAHHKEKDVALAVALQLGKYINQYCKDVKVIYTRSTDVFVELQERAAIANRNKADLFISIHCNSASYKDKKTKKIINNPDAHGSETYVMGIKNEKGKLDVAKRENSAMLLEDDYEKKYDGFDPNSDEAYIIMSLFTDTYLEQSLNLSSKIQNNYKTLAARKDKGVKRASLWVLWRTAMPSLLTEIGFLTNPDEENFLGSEKGQNYIATSIFKAFREYKDEIEGNKTVYTDEIELKNNYEVPKDSSKHTPTLLKDSTEKPKVEIKTDEPKETKNEIILLQYRVQIASSDKKLKLDSDVFKGVKPITEYEDKGIYKYAAGNCKNLDEATKLQKELRKKKFPDAFVIVLKNGKRISVEEAKKLIK